MLSKLLLLIILNHATSSKIAGVVTTNLTDSCYDAAISDDASTIICTSLIFNEAYIIKNIQTGFKLNQTIGLQMLGNEVGVDGQGNIIMIGYYPNTEIYEKTDSGEYQLFQNISHGIQSFYGYSIFVQSNGKYYIRGFSDGKIHIFKKQDEYQLLQQIHDSSSQIQAISGTKYLQIIAIGGFDHKVRIYKKINQQFQLNQVIEAGFQVYFLKLTKKNLLICGNSSQILFYQNNETSYLSQDVLEGENTLFKKVSISDDFQKMELATSSNKLRSYERKDNLYLLTEEEDIQPYSQAFGDPTGLYFLVITRNKSIKTYYKCSVYCSECYFPNNCSICDLGYQLDGYKCYKEVKDNDCTDNKEVRDGVCEEYCSKECKSCKEEKNFCIECSEYYKMKGEGQCVLQSEALTVFMDTKPALNMAKKRGMKMIFIAFDDLWLYHYHKQQYDGVAKDVFQLISLMQENQWEIIGLSGFLGRIEDKIIDSPKYNAFSNEKYMKESRKNNFLINNIIDYLVLSVPSTIILVFLINRLFYLLFNYQISKFIRPYSFWLILLELTFQGNIQFFTFLSFRAISTMFSFNFSTKILNGFSIIFFFITFICATCSYTIYYHRYRKLARYFLSNMYRFPSSYVLMTIVYGIKPYLKGAIHALFYDEWVLQIWLLIGVELLVVFIILVFEIALDNHKSTLILCIELIYSFALVSLNLLLLCKHQYFKEDEQVKEELEIALMLIVSLMAILLIMRFLSEIKEAVRCKCERLSSSVKPINGNSEEKKGKKGKKKKKNKKKIESQQCKQQEKKQQKQEDNKLPIKRKDGVQYVEFDVGDQKIRFQRDLRDDELEAGENSVADYCLRKYERCKEQQKIKSEKKAENCKEKKVKKK